MSIPRVLLRPLLLAVLLGALLGLVLPYQVGIHVRNSLQDRVQALPGAQLLRRDKGLFRSRYRLVLPVQGSAVPLILNISVRHGPYWQPGVAGGPAWVVLDLTPAADSPVQLLRWSRKRLKLRIRLGLLGKWYMSLAGKGAAAADGTLRLQYDPLGQTLRGSVDMDGLRVLAPRQRLLLGRTHLDLDVTRHDTGHWQGEVGVDVHRVGVLRGDYRWLADGLQLRLRQGPGTGRHYRDVDGSVTLASLRRLAPMPRGARLSQATGDQPLGPYSLIFAADDARADLLPALWRMVKAASGGAELPGEAGGEGHAAAAAGSTVGLSRFLRRVRNGPLPDLIQALAPAQTRIASLGLVWPAGSIHLEGRLRGPGRGKPHQWQGRLSLVLRGAPLPPTWRRNLRPLLVALRADGPSRIGECVLDQGGWRVNGRPVDIRSWLAKP